jgi:asparagine synthase (glutamine-hydrolysing)
MCGIAGIYNSNKSARELEAVGRFMASQLHHRGPDANGIRVRQTSSGSKVLLTHTRLSIIDLSDAAAQPMSFADQTLWLTFNGEIYNFNELRDELIQLGVTFRSHSDTEVILAVYRHWGLKGFERFVGMWALALWDEKEDLLVLSRDRLGVKPLYYCQQGDAWLFGSEPKVIVEQVPETRQLNLQAISDYFSFRYVLGGDSFFNGIHSVEAGTHKIIRGRTVKTVRYWDLPVEMNKQDPGEQDAMEQVDTLLASAVNYRMIADVPVGSFLSGGLDSSALVWEMAQQHDEPIRTFSIGFDEDGYNEFEYAREVALSCGTRHREISLDVNQYLDAFQTMLSVKDAPLAVPNEIALHKLSLLLKQDVTVVLSGEGADELFGGYGRIFRSAYDYQRVEAKPGSLSEELAGNLRKKYPDFDWHGEVGHFLGQYSYLSNASKQQIFCPGAFASLGDDPHNSGFFSQMWPRLDGLDLAEKYMWIFQRVHLEGLLGRLDSATMSASVEGRVPFVDHRLIESVNRLPLHYKMHWRDAAARQQAANLNSDQISENLDITKYLLRSCFQDRLPARIINRKKVGFPVPLGNWLSGKLRDYAIERLLADDARSQGLFQRQTIEQLLHNSATDAGDGLKVWMLLNVEDWMRQYAVSY